MPAWTGKSLVLTCSLNLILLTGLAPGAASQAVTPAPNTAGPAAIASSDTAPPAVLSPADSAVQRNRTLAELHSNLDTLAKRIEEIKIGIGKAGAKAKQKTKDELAALERAREGIAARLDSLGGATADAWGRLKSRAAKEMDSLRSDIDRVKKKAKG